MANYFSINGYWKDDKTPIDGSIVKDTDEVDESEDDTIFHYGLTEINIQSAIKAGADTDLEFVITSYEKH